MTTKEKIVIVGATSAIAEQCARLWVNDDAIDMTLIGRDQARTARIAQDLKVRSPDSEISVITTNFLCPESIKETVDNICSTSPVDKVLIAHGSMPSQQKCQEDLQENRNTLEINGLSPVIFAEAFASKMALAQKGVIAIISSVAGDRGRKTNYVYGSAKGLVNRYTQGLQHRFAGTGISVVLIKPGPTDTPMTAELKQKGKKLAAPSVVANAIVQGIKQRKPVIYAPGKWAIIMTIIIHLPRFIFNKLDI